MELKTEVDLTWKIKWFVEIDEVKIEVKKEDYDYFNRDKTTNNNRVGQLIFEAMDNKAVFDLIVRFGQATKKEEKKQ